MAALSQQDTPKEAENRKGPVDWHGKTQEHRASLRSKTGKSKGRIVNLGNTHGYQNIQTEGGAGIVGRRSLPCPAALVGQERQSAKAKEKKEGQVRDSANRTRSRSRISVTECYTSAKMQ